MNPAWMDKKSTGEKAGFAAVFPDFTRRDEKSPKDLWNLLNLTKK